VEIWLVRHAATAWNEEGRHQGRSDVPLSPTGERQAARLQRVLPRAFAAVRASTLLRARQTARIASGREPTALEDLREIDRGEWEGLVPAEITARWPDLHRRWYDDPRGLSMPGGESFDALWERAGGVLEDLAGSGGMVLAVGHKAINRVVIARALGRPTKGVWGIPQPQACLTVLRGGGGAAWQADRIADVSHLPPDLRSST